MTEAKEIWDYYYSPTQEDRMIRNSSYHIPPLPYLDKFYDGKPFTIMVKTGTPHDCNFDDMVLVGTGDESLTEYKR